MQQVHLVRRMFQVGAFGAAVMSWTTPGMGEPDRPVDRRACTSAYKGALESEQAAHFRRAKELILTCMETCGAAVKQKCAVLAVNMEADTPSVVPIVTDAAGAPRVDVRVMVDGELLTSRLNGMALPIDPGMHEFSFTANDRVFATQRIMIIEGQRNLAIPVSMDSSEKRGKTAAPDPIPSRPPETTATSHNAAPDAAASTKSESAKPDPAAYSEAANSLERPRRGRSHIPYVMGGVGFAGVGVYALLTNMGGSDTLSNVSLGVGVVGLAAAFTSWFWLNHDAPKDPANASTLVLDVHPTRAGAVATVSRSF